MKTKLKNFISRGFVDNMGLVAQPKIYQFEGKPYVGYVIYQEYISFWMTFYHLVDVVPDLEDLHKKYEGIKIVY
jgi:hypothetical protein